MSKDYREISKEVIYYGRRPEWLPFRASNGIVEVNFFPEKLPDEDTAHSRLEHFIQYGLSISTQNTDDKNGRRADFRLLDTSMSDSSRILREIFRASLDIQRLHKKRGKIEILLADPLSSFAKTRAKSISDIEEDFAFRAQQKCSEGLRAIAKQVNFILDDSASSHAIDADVPGEKRDKDVLQEIEELTDYIKNFGARCGVELLFYSEVPSGPMYFLQSILIQGRYCSGFSAVKLPWLAIVNNPYCNNDFYDIFSDEFQQIWDSSAEAGYDKPGKALDLTSVEIERLRKENEELQRKYDDLRQLVE